MSYPDTPFTPFDLSHGLAVMVVVLIGYSVFSWVKRHPTRGSNKRLRVVFALLLFYSAIAGIVNALIRPGIDSLARIHETEYPFFLCDVVSIVLAVALLKKSQRLTEVGYLWGMAGTAQGLLTPVMRYDFPSPEYFTFFLQHGGVPIAAVLLVWGYGLKPEKGAYKRIWIWTFAYLLITMALNFILETNYSFLNEKPAIPTAFDLLGDYPWYLLSLHALAAVIYGLLLLPFRCRKG